MRSSRHLQRGQAYVEFAISLSLLVGALFFTMAVARYAALNERVQTSVRYAGLIAENQDPYLFASMTSTYRSLKSDLTTDDAAMNKCMIPDKDVLSGQGVFKGGAAAQFWLPNGTVSTSCKHTRTIFPGTSMTGDDLLFEQYAYSISADASGYSTWLTNFGGSTGRPVKASVVIYRPPSVTVLLHCYHTLGSVVNNSVFPPAAQINGGKSAVAPLTAGDVLASRQSFSVKAGACQALSQNPGPHLIPSSPIPSQQPLPTPTPIPTIKPTPSPSPKPATPKPAPPSPKPTGAPTSKPPATPKPAGTPKGPLPTQAPPGGGGNPSGGGGSTPKPATPKPATPKPATPKPTAAPATTAPVTTTNPTPIPSGNPGAAGGGGFNF